MAEITYPIPRGIVAALRGEKCCLCRDSRTPSVRVPVRCQRFDLMSSGGKRPHTCGVLCGLCDPFHESLRIQIGIRVERGEAIEQIASAWGFKGRELSLLEPPLRLEARHRGVMCVPCAQHSWRDEGRGMPGCAIWISPDERRRRKRAAARSGGAA
jgi:hypothetical protein